MSNVGDLAERKERPAYVRFEKVAVEDKAASLREGHYVARDVDMALITPPYSKDVFKIKVPQWFENMKQDVQNGRMSEEWSDNYHKAYERWRLGQEIPLNGTAIKGWGVISPAQQETLIRMNVLTVEDLGGINDEGMKRIGMGGIDLKNKANAWLAQLTDKGPLTLRVAAAEAENALLKSNVATLTGQVQALMAQVKATQGFAAPQVVSTAGIDASDILDPVAVIPEPAVRRGPGRPKKVDSAQPVPPMTQPASGMDTI